MVGTVVWWARHGGHPWPFQIGTPSPVELVAAFVMLIQLAILADAAHTLYLLPDQPRAWLRHYCEFLVIAALIVSLGPWPAYMGMYWLLAILLLGDLTVLAVATWVLVARRASRRLQRARTSDR
jgi:hypothetical protein